MEHGYASTYDPEADALYALLLDEPIVRTDELLDGLLVDVAPDGRVVGVEVLTASAGWNTDALTAQFDLPASARKYLAELAAH